MKFVRYFVILYFMLLFTKIRSFANFNLRLNSMRMISDTIYSVSSGPVIKSGVAVVRLSGPKSKYCLEKITKRPCPEPRYAALRKLYCPESGDPIDKALVLWFPGPRSFTGEDCVEFHLHGSRAVVAGLFKAFEFLDTDILTNDGSGAPSIGRSVLRQQGIRPAERGEFTRRGFENNKMDLTEVEGLADLLESQTAEQRKQALRQMEGHMKIKFEKWREELLKCLAHTEAVIDFGDDDRENDIDDSVMWHIVPKVEALKRDIVSHIDDSNRGELIREGVRITLVGRPNAGKSSLLNALARRPAAIVDAAAGTTRDVVEVRLDLGGIPCLVCDTAGLRSDSANAVELEGMRRAREAYRSAQIKLLLRDASDDSSQESLASLLANLESTSGDEVDSEDEDDSLDRNTSNSILILVDNKIDLLQSSPGEVAPSGVDVQRISCTTGAGLPELEDLLKKTLITLLGRGDDNTNTLAAPQEHVLITRQRHRRHLNQCLRHIDRFLLTDLPMDAAAEELRLAMMELGRVTGRVDVEELLDVIFRDFCIGK